MTPTNPNRFDDFFADEAYVSLKNHLYNYRLRRRAVQKQIQSARGGLILEIGSGISPMTEKSDGIVYSDLSFAAMQKLKRAYQGSVCVVADAGRLPFRAGSFNQIICSEVLEHLPEDRPALSEIASVLKQGGFLILTFPHRRLFFAVDDRFVNHFRRYELNEMTQKLEEADLKAIRIQKLFGPLEKLTMMTVISLIAVLDRFRKGQPSRETQKRKNLSFFDHLFIGLNRLYCVPIWLDARLAPRCLSSVLLVRAVKI